MGIYACTPTSSPGSEVEIEPTADARGLKYWLNGTLAVTTTLRVYSHVPARHAGRGGRRDERVFEEVLSSLTSATK